MPEIRILTLAGSLRKGSHNQRLVDCAGEIARASGAEVIRLRLADFDLPMFNEDVEAAGTPRGAAALKKAFIDADGLLLACPEYNSSITAALKNAIDWVSRPAQGEPPLAGFQGKIASLMAASPGALGGLRGLTTVRSILGNIGVLVLPEQLAVSRAHEAFDGESRLKDAAQAAILDRMVRTLVQSAAKLKAR